jgi:Domain of Unknown Function (DUF1080)
MHLKNSSLGIMLALAAFAVVAPLSTKTSAQTPAFTRADSGWVKIFNGTDWTGIFSRNWGANAPRQSPPGAPWQLLYTGTDTAVIRVTSANPGGNISTEKNTYSHYRMRVEHKFDVLGQTLNGGLTYHTDETPSLIRMNNNWPRSIEFQMQQREQGSAYSIQQCTFTTRVNGNRYAPTGGTEVQVCETGCNGRNYVSNPTPNPAGPGNVPRWMRYELVVRGSDSAIHIINDTVVFKLWNIRVFNDNQNNTPNGPYSRGAFSLQSEGAVINYRRWEVMEFPAGTPLREHYLHRLFLDNPDQGVNLQGNATYAVKWRTIGSTGANGTVPTVKLQYALGSGAWQSIGDSIPNTGSYDWKVPNTPTQQLRLRISAADWVWADSSSGFNTIESTTGLKRSKVVYADFSIQGKGKVWAAIEGFQSVHIHDAFGREVKSLPLNGRSQVWDLTDAAGRPVQPGVYFLRAVGEGKSRMARTLVGVGG